MQAVPNYNQSNLLPSPTARVGTRPTLDQMRAKLATSKPSDFAAPKIVRKKKSKNQSVIWVAVIGGLLISANYLMFTNKEKLMDTVGIQRVLKPLTAPANLNDEERALFWAHVAYTPDQLGTRYKISPDAVIDPEDAKHHLASILSKGVTFKVRKEILALSTPPKI